jgi:hypothetical protein
MKYYGTKNNKDYGFYEQKFDGAIEITDEYWQKLLNQQNQGKMIIFYENSVIAVDESDYEFKNDKWIKLSETEKEVKQLTIQNAVRVEEIQQEIETLDKKRIRAIAEPSLKDESTTWLEYYTNKISELRTELTKLL